MTFIAPTMTDEEVAAWEQQMRTIEPPTDRPLNSEKAVAIGVALLDRFPCAVLPPGTLTDMGAEFGVSREYVRQIARLVGATSTRGAIRNPKPLRFCGSCGKEINRYGQNAVCRDCLTVEVACGNCGSLVRRSAARLANQIGRTTSSPDGKRATYTGRVFCDRHCFGQWFGRTYGTGTREMRRRGPSITTHGNRAVYLRGCRCDLCVTAMRAFWRDQKRKVAK